MDDKTTETAPLEELRQTIDRIKELTAEGRKRALAVRNGTYDPVEAEREEERRRRGRAGGGGVFGAGRRARARNGRLLRGEKNDTKQSEKQDTRSPNRRGKRSKGKPLTSPERQLGSSADSSNDLGDRDCQFVPFSTESEEELVELMRRTAELVVRAERSAAASSTPSRKSSSSEDDEDEFELNVAVFEHFCERNALSLIVNIVTGATFEDQDDNNNQSSLLLLPPSSIAVQAVQSVSILIQNVVRPTSLYFLLSNNRVNDLISLPLEAYTKAAIRRAKEINRVGTSDTDDGSTAAANAEVSELATHFVSFLRSLAVRINVETLQFFLSYPNEKSPFGKVTNQKKKDGQSNHADRSEVENEEKGSEDPTTTANANEDLRTHEDEYGSVERVRFPLYDRALQFCSNDHDQFVRVTAMNICLNTLRLAAREDETNDISEPPPPSASEPPPSPVSRKIPNAALHKSDPLPKRERLAISRHICTPSRVALLSSSIFERLAQLCDSIEVSIRKMEELDARRRRRREELLNSARAMTPSSSISRGGSESSISTTTTTATTSSQKTEGDDKPNRAFEVPRNLERESSNRYKQLQQLNHDMEMEKDTKRAMAATKWARKRKEMKAKEADKLDDKNRVQLADALRNVVCDLQDELLLLEDMFNVGLTSLNEQVIEMMFATFVYPFLLQPLLLYMQRCRSSSSRTQLNTSEILSSSGIALDESDIGEKENEKAQGHDQDETISDPFMPDGISASLVETGLLSDRDIHDDNGVSSDALNNNVSHPDTSPVKTALFAIASVFHIITNRPLLHLLLVAIFHPSAPDTSSGAGAIIHSTPRFFATDARDDGAGEKSDETKHPSSPNLYDFGRSTRGDETQNPPSSGAGDLCIFVLSPALADVFEVSGKRKFSTPPLTNSIRLRPNPYRRVALSCLAGTDGMTPLRSLAVHVMDSALSAVKVQVIADVVFGIGLKSNICVPTGKAGFIPSEGNNLDSTNGGSDGDGKSFVLSPVSPSHMIEMVAAMCVSVMTATLSVNGLWKLDFDRVAAHALGVAISFNATAKAAAAKLINHRHEQSAMFLSQLPSRIDTVSVAALSADRSGDGPKSIREDQNDQALRLIMDRIFFDRLGSSRLSLLEQVLREMDDSGGWKSPVRVPVALESSFDDVADSLCSNTSMKNEVFASYSRTASLQSAAKSAFAHLQLDAFRNLLLEYKIEESREPLNDRSILWSSLSPNDDDGDDSFGPKSSNERTFYSPLSPPLGSALFDEGNENANASSGDSPPEAGSVVSLVGRTAFPCVCEVSAANSSLFTDKGACVVAEGVKWQSLYLVLLGRYMILAEPEKGGSTGNGRISISCPLACLGAEKDDPPVSENESPARRLILTHSSPDPIPPGVFTVESSENSPSARPKDSVKIIRSRMDLWFEDSTAAGHAYRVLCSKIVKARARRGYRIQEKLTSLFNKNP